MPGIVFFFPFWNLFQFYEKGIALARYVFSIPGTSSHGKDRMTTSTTFNLHKRLKQQVTETENGDFERTFPLTSNLTEEQSSIDSS